MHKTNVMRLLEKEGICFRTLEYEVDEHDLSGEHVARQLGQPPEQVFKTLVLKGEKKGCFVCCIPVCKELDLKKAARAAGEKKVDMIPMKDLQKVTGYIRGGCSPVGMKKKFPVFFDESGCSFSEIAVSAGIRGAQIVLSPEDLLKYVDGRAIGLVL